MSFSGNILFFFKRQNCFLGFSKIFSKRQGSILGFARHFLLHLSYFAIMLEGSHSFQPFTHSKLKVVEN